MSPPPKKQSFHLASVPLSRLLFEQKAGPAPNSLPSTPWPSRGEYTTLLDSIEPIHLQFPKGVPGVKREDSQTQEEDHVPKRMKLASASIRRLGTASSRTPISPSNDHRVKNPGLVPSDLAKEMTHLPSPSGSSRAPVLQPLLWGLLPDV